MNLWVVELEGRGEKKKNKKVLRLRVSGFIYFFRREEPIPMIITNRYISLLKIRVLIYIVWGLNGLTPSAFWS